MGIEDEIVIIIAVLVVGTNINTGSTEIMCVFCFSDLREIRFSERISVCRDYLAGDGEQSKQRKGN